MSESKNIKDRSSMKDFESFRIYLKKIYEYCSFNADDFKNLDVEIGKSKYNDYKNKAMSLSKSKVEEQKVGKKRNVLKYDVNQFESSYNFLSNAYFFRTLTANKIESILFIISYLAVNGEASMEKIKEILRESQERNVKIIVKDCVESGIIYRDENKKYRIVGIDKKFINPENQLRILNFVDFMKDIIYPNAFGYYLFEDLKYIYEKSNGEYISPFQIKNQYSANILDEEVLWKIINSKIEKKYISFEYKNKLYKKVNAVKIIVEKQKHRMYLFAYCPNDKNKPEKIFRLSKIYKAEISKDSTEEDQKILERKYIEYSKDAFMGIPVSSSEKISITFKFAGKLRSEIKDCFSSAEISDDTAKITVSDLKTVIPWFKSHIGLLEIMDNQQLKEILDEEIKEMKKLYGVV